MKKPIVVFAGIVLAVGVLLAYSSVFTVHQAQQALVLQFGNPIRVEREPGIKLKLPFIQDVTYYDRRILDLDPPVVEVPLADQKRINLDSYARYRIVDPLEYRKKAFTDANFRAIFGARLNSVLRDEVGRASLDEMLSPKRTEIMDRLTQTLKGQAREFGVEVIDVRIVRTDLPEATSQALYNRMRSSRVAQAAQLRAEGEELKAKIQAEADRERTVLLAEAEKSAQALRGQGDGLKTEILNRAYGKDREFFDFYRSLEALGSALSEGTSLVLRPDSEYFRLFGGPLGQGDKPKK